MDHKEKLQWMGVWAAKNGMELTLDGKCGLGRECVGVTVNDVYPDYRWYTDDYERADNNGEVWRPADAYHKHECVAVLGWGEAAEAQLYDWLRWFDKNGFKMETGDQKMDPNLGMIGLLLGKNRYVRLVRTEMASS